MTALLSAWKNDNDKCAIYVAEAREMGIEVLPPDVSSSEYDFSIVDLPEGKSAIRFGLGAVKNVGQSPVDEIIHGRSAKPFKNIDDFAKRVDLRKVGKRPLECLIKLERWTRWVTAEQPWLCLNRSSTFLPVILEPKKWVRWICLAALWPENKP